MGGNYSTIKTKFTKKHIYFCNCIISKKKKKKKKTIKLNTTTRPTLGGPSKNLRACTLINKFSTGKAARQAYQIKRYTTALAITRQGRIEPQCSHEAEFCQRIRFVALQANSS